MNRRQFIGSAAAVSLTAAASFARAHVPYMAMHIMPVMLVTRILHRVPTKPRAKRLHIALKPVKSVWHTASPC